MRTISANAPTIAKEIWEQIAVKDNEWNLSPLDEKILSEQVLQQIASEIKSNDAYGVFFGLLYSMPYFGRNFDWNVGSIIRHFKFDLLSTTIRCVGVSRAVRGSMGLSWVLGEVEDDSGYAVSLLRSILCSTDNHESWWLAAHSLSGKLSDVSSIELMLDSLHRIGFSESLNYCLSDLGDCRSACGVLLSATRSKSVRDVTEVIVENFEGCNDRVALRNCCWLSEQMALCNDSVLEGLVNCSRDRDYNLRHAAITAIGQYPDRLKVGILDRLTESRDDMSRRLAKRFLATYETRG